jgi:hypothetical protein
MGAILARNLASREAIRSLSSSGAGAPGRPGLDSGGQLAWPQGSVWVLDVDGGQVQHSGYPSPLRLRDPQAGYYYQIAPRSVAFRSIGRST